MRILLDTIEIFLFKYFSEETKDNPKTNWVRYMFTGMLLLLALMGAITYSAGLKTIGLVLILCYTAILFVFGLLWIVIFFYHNWRLK